MEVKRVFDLLSRFAELFPEKQDVFSAKENGIWVKTSTKDYIENSNNISYGLLALGVKRGDKIASIMPNRPEWNFLDIGIQQVGAIHIPIYPTISDKDYLYILQHAEVNYVFVEGAEMYRRIKHLIKDIPTLKTVYTFNKIEGVDDFSQLLELGEKNQAKVELQTIKDSISENDILTIIYTSGTTGHPKGVVLTHKNLVFNFVGVSYIPAPYPQYRAMSFLPLCHIYERMINYMYQYLGLTTFYAENLASVADNMKEVNPEILSTVPRFLERIYDKIVNKGRKLTGIKKIMFFWALKLGTRYELNGENGWFYEFQLKIARKLVFVKWKEALGGNLDLIVSGGAAIQPKLERIFWAAGFRVIAGYGLTETSPVVSVNTLDKNGVKFGTVGPVLKGIEIKIAEDGEILTKGPCLMQSYYKEPEMTKEAIDCDGWFHTGDIGTLLDSGQLKITGRKKEIFKTSFGKYIAPQFIEDKFKESPLIENLFVIGENQKFAAAIIAPDFPHLREWCEENKIEFTTNKETLEKPEVKMYFKKEIAKYNSELGDTEQIKKYEIVDSEWSIESGEITATLKLRRTFMQERYKPLIDKIFNQ
ncbi:MAG: long-chain fatty acid--CoA ligase [Bacteroidetes bacterium]|nr:long-chain fatty acid--CoA ligase [Bacteroidota bacterium]